MRPSILRYAIGIVQSQDEIRHCAKSCFWDLWFFGFCILFGWIIISTQVLSYYCDELDCILGVTSGKWGDDIHVYECILRPLFQRFVTENDYSRHHFLFQNLLNQNWSNSLWLPVVMLCHLEVLIVPIWFVMFDNAWLKWEDCAWGSCGCQLLLSGFHIHGVFIRAITMSVAVKLV